MVLSSPSKPLSVTYGPVAADPTLGAPGSGSQRRAKKASANGRSLVEAKPKPVSHPRRGDGDEQAEALVPAQAVGPPDV
jgi:hypothetical protein